MEMDGKKKTRTSPKEFEVVDPYNGNEVKGTIFVDNTRYGNIMISEVNGKPCEQYIHTTPKFYYPGNVSSPRFYEEGKFPEFRKINVYDKLDGTNIFMFSYKDPEGKRYVSYKTRLVPFLSVNGFKDWISLWGRMLKKYEDAINDLSGIEGLNFGFELYGGINKILIDYDVALDAKLLYAIDENGNIIDPETFSFPKPSIIATLEPGTDPDASYKEREAILEEVFTRDRSAEGCVFYVHSKDGGVIPWKCKPPSVLEAQSEENKIYISVDDAYTTAMNAAESITSIDELPEQTYLLLEEVYDEHKIERSKGQVEKAIEQARTYLSMQKKVLDVFKDLGLEWDESRKGDIMREMMQHFPRGMSSKVYTMVKRYFEAFEEGDQ